MNKAILHQIEEIKTDKIHGAGWLSRRAMKVLANVASQSAATSKNGLLHELKQVISLLKTSRPDMVSVFNYASLFENQLEKYAVDEHTRDQLKEYSLLNARNIANKSRTATRKAADTGALLLSDNSTVISCSYSSTLCKTLIYGRKKGLKFRTIIAESLFNGKAYGSMAADYLKRHKISAIIINDNEIIRYIIKATLAMVGADCVFRDGSLVNGTPSYALADAAYKAQMPLYAICETAKFDSRINNSIKIGEPGFDHIPAEMVTEIITESGKFRPSDIDSFMSR